MFRSLLAYTLSLILVGSYYNALNAGSISISKMSVTLKSDGSAETIRVDNRDSYATSVQILALAWDAKDGDLDPVPDIIAVPPVFDLPPAGKQIVRLAARGLNSENSEMAFVLLIKETPTEVLDEPGNLAFALNIRLPLFVTPERAKAEPSWQLHTSEDGKPQLTLINQGNSHLSMNNIALSSLPDGGLLSEIKKSGYILAGQRRSWPIDTELEELKGPLSLRAEANIGPIDTVLFPPSN